MPYLSGIVLASIALVWTVSTAAAQQSDCHWVGNGVALRCHDDLTGGPTLSAWQGAGWATVPAGAGGPLPATGGGLSTFGRTFPPSPVTPASGYASASWQGNTLS